MSHGPPSKHKSVPGSRRAADAAAARKPRSKRRILKRVLLWVVTPLLFIAVSIVLVDPFFRQLIFGPKYGGIPLYSWKQMLREEWKPQEPPQEPWARPNLPESGQPPKRNRA